MLQRNTGMKWTFRITKQTNKPKKNQSDSVKMSKYTSTHCSVHVHSILARLSFSALLCYSSTVKLTNQHVLFATFNRITGSHVWQMSLWYPHQHSFTLWLNYEQKKKRRESPCERVKEWGREKWRNEGSEGCRGGEMLKYELQTRAAPSGPRKHTS